MSVSCWTAAEMVTPHHARKSASLAHADHIHILLAGEDLHQHLGADLQSIAVRLRRSSFTFSGLGCRLGAVFFGVQRDLADKLYRRQIMLAEVPLHGLGDV